MPLKSVRPPTEFEEIDSWSGGFGWLAYPDETMQRASHALCIDQPDEPDAPDDIWVVDPLRAPGIDDRLRDLGNIVGVVVLLDRHGRDAASFARRHDVPLYLPAWIDIDVPDDVGIVRIEEGLPGTDYELHETVDLPGWHEAALYDGETLVLADALGNANYFTTGDEELGVHPFLRAIPPRALRKDGVTPKRILLGHGAGIMDRATPVLRDAMQSSRRRMPGLYLQMVRRALPSPPWR